MTRVSDFAPGEPRGFRIPVGGGLEVELELREPVGVDETTEFLGDIESLEALRFCAKWLPKLDAGPDVYDEAAIVGFVRAAEREARALGEKPLPVFRALLDAAGFPAPEEDDEDDGGGTGGDEGFSSSGSSAAPPD